MKTQLRILKAAWVALAFWIQSFSPVLAQAPLADTFNPGADSDVLALAIQPDGRILVGGAFSNLAGTPHAYLGRLNADGTSDAAFNAGADGTVNCLAVQADGKIVVGGAFTMLAGQPRASIGRLNSDGTVDMDFNPGTNGNVFALAVQPDGKILVGGFFTTLGGQSRNNIARLNADGTLDLNFHPDADSFVYALGLQADGQIIVAGNFTVLSGQPCQCVGRLTTSGNLDPAFNAGMGGPSDPNPEVYTVAVQADGNILVGGNFLVLGGAPSAYIGRLLTNGTLDANFSATANNPVNSLALEADGKVLASGAFTRIDDQDHGSLARLATNGALDPGFNPDATAIECLALQPDGKILAGGYFGNLGSQKRARIGRLNSADLAVQTLSVTASMLTWTRQGTCPEILQSTFDYSPDGVSWVPLGPGIRIPGGWQFAGLTASTNSTFRARGHVAGGYNGSDWFVETLLFNALSITDATQSGATQFKFNISGTLGQTVIVETSSNLTTWTPLRTNLLTVLPFRFTDSLITGVSNRFYRLRLGP